MDRARALTIVRDLAAALEAAHRRQIVHRDLKPENIWLVSGADSECAKVLDFGLATVIASADAELPAPAGDGSIQGTPLYMAPEQIRGEDPDRGLGRVGACRHRVRNDVRRPSVCVAVVHTDRRGQWRSEPMNGSAHLPRSVGVILQTRVGHRTRGRPIVGRDAADGAGAGTSCLSRQDLAALVRRALAGAIRHHTVERGAGGRNPGQSAIARKRSPASATPTGVRSIHSSDVRATARTTAPI